MPRKIEDPRKKQSILIPVRVNVFEHRLLKRGAELMHLPPATFTRIAVLDRALAEILRAQVASVHKRRARRLK
jgi:uncharacterized protein (DUF1778 family)